MNNRRILRELGDHLPFSVFFTAAGIVLAALLTYGAMIAGLAGEGGPAPAFTDAARMLFHIFHPVHLLLSAMATTAMFYRYERRLVKAIAVGLVGSVGICGLSDVFMPFLAGKVLNMQNISFHWCLQKHPQMVLPFAALGIASGLIAATTVDRSTIISHSAHIFISSTASLFYLISYGLAGWYTESWLAPVFLVVILCVTIPCCLSDILFPLFMTGGDNPPACDCRGEHA